MLGVSSMAGGVGRGCRNDLKLDDEKFFRSEPPCPIALDKTREGELGRTGTWTSFSVGINGSVLGADVVTAPVHGSTGIAVGIAELRSSQSGCLDARVGGSWSVLWTLEPFESSNALRDTVVVTVLTDDE